jgi:hypothetical protein
MLGHNFAEPGQLLEPAPDIAGRKERLRWRLNRLRCMTPAEITHRVLRTLSMHAERTGLLGTGMVPLPDLVPTPRPWVHATARVDTAQYLAAADRIAGGRLDVFALRDIELGTPPRWNRDPKSGVEAPLSFGKLLDYRDPQMVGDIKYLWEPNRHMHFVTLAQAYALSGDPRYFHVIQEHLESWLASCPYRMGPNWSSALEPAIRLINWSVAWQLLGGAFSPGFEGAVGARFRQQWLESIFQHAQFVRGHFSLYSSANNHLIGEAAGLFIAAVTWPYWPRARAWLPEAKAILEREALLQNAQDGVNLEQTVSYQRFELDLLLLSLLAGRANGHEFPAAFKSRIEAMMEYLASIMDAGGNVPMNGDSDDGYVVNLVPGRGFCGYRSLLATGALLFGRGDFKVKAAGLDDETRWLFGESADAAFQSLDAARARLPVRRAFPLGGYYIIGCDFESANEIRLVVDAGPLGYQAIAAHGHADALAFTLSVGGKEFFIDPGTYTYHTQGPWRQYFRGTAAHNTVRVDGVDQSQSGGTFMWLKKAGAGCSLWRSSAERDLFEGWHDGYMRLGDPVMHRRRITFDKPARRFYIEDVLEARGEHEVELFFHCSERCRVTPVASGYAISQGTCTLMLQLPRGKGGVSRLYYGSDSPLAGWISRRFDHKQPTWTIAWRNRIAGQVALTTEISVRTDADPCPI